MASTPVHAVPSLNGRPVATSAALIVEKTFGKLTPYSSLAFSDYEELSTGRNHSVAVGLAYDVEALSKLKGEVARIRTGSDSFLFDAIPADREANVLTLSFSRIF